jgi:hypothetical protein
MVPQYPLRSNLFIGRMKKRPPAWIKIKRFLTKLVQLLGREEDDLVVFVPKTSIKVRLQINGYFL